MGVGGVWGWRHSPNNYIVWIASMDRYHWVCVYRGPPPPQMPGWRGRGGVTVQYMYQYIIIILHYITYTYH